MWLYCRCRGASLWQWMCRLAVGGQRRKKPSGRVLLCGGVAFLWERERIGNEDVIRYTCMCGYVYVHLHVYVFNHVTLYMHVHLQPFTYTCM